MTQSSASRDQLEGAVGTLSRLGALSDQQAQLVAQRMDRLASQLLEASAPHRRSQLSTNGWGTEPADPEEFRALVDRMGPADGEG